MDDVAIARALHVLAIVLWIGGVSLVTTVLLPALRRLPDPAHRIAIFEAIENRFGAQARLTVVVTGLSGIWMLVRMDAWYRFALLPYWWMHAMLLVWLIFAIMLFILEPLVLHRWFASRPRQNLDGTFRTIQRFHMILLALSMLAILGSVAGGHGLLLFG